MRPYLVLSAVVLMAVAAFGQQPVPYPYGGCFYGCGPYGPACDHAEVSLQQFSPNPVGATQRHHGPDRGCDELDALADSGIDQFGHTAWPCGYQGGGAPLISQGVNLSPELIGREGRITHPAMHDGMREAQMREESFREEHFREMPSREGRQGEARAREEHGQRSSEEARVNWNFITGASPASAATNSPKAGRVYTNDDVKRQNDNNGTVKYDGKTEKI